MKEFWDQRYGSEEYAYGVEPNAFFKEQIDRLKPGKMLLPAEGEGRNAVYAASRGWEVTAVDYSAVAMKKAMSLAQKLGVEIDYRVLALGEYKCDEKFDAVGLVFIHLRPEERVHFHHRMIGCLKEGGVIIAELFHKKQLQNKTGGPPAIELLYESSTLEEDFHTLKVEYLKDERIILEEGPFHSGPADVVRFVGRKI
jgi:SAM-dependent methyltransferase